MNIDPITLREIPHPIKGHIIPEKMDVSQKTVLVDPEVDHLFGTKYEAKLYDHLDMLLNEWHGRLEVFEGVSLKTDFTIEEGKNVFKIHPSGGEDARKYILDGIKEAFVPGHEVHFKFSYSPYAAKIAVLHSVYLGLWDLNQELAKNLWLRDLLLRITRDEITDLEKNFVNNMVGISHSDCFSSDCLNVDFSSHTIHKIETEILTLVFIRLKEPFVGSVIMPSYGQEFNQWQWQYKSKKPKKVKLFNQEGTLYLCID